MDEPALHQDDKGCYVYVCCLLCVYGSLNRLHLIALNISLSLSALSSPAGFQRATAARRRGGGGGRGWRRMRREEGKEEREEDKEEAEAEEEEKGGA
eukprot:3835956-Pyramimonas_sp.AAC.1